MENVAETIGSGAGSLLEIRNLRAWYGKDKTVLSDLTLNLKKQEVVGLIGLNGAGKTTLIKTISGLHETFQADAICFRDSPVTFRDESFKRQRYTVFAEDDSFRYFTFREYLSYVLSAYRKEQDSEKRHRKFAGAFWKQSDCEELTRAVLENRDAAADISALIGGFHFEEYMDTLIKDLSTGNRKKMFLITAFTLRPRLLLLDEPVNGLDFQSTEFLYQQISGYKKYGTVLFSSHILESIALTCDRVLVLENGCVSHTFEHTQLCAEEIRKTLAT